MAFQIWDNGGKTIDRYTVIFDGSVYTMSENALSPQGVNMYMCEVSEIIKRTLKHERKMKFTELPQEVQTAIWKRKNTH